jgi:O-antigen/teichoic acid export membrane protein
MAFSMFVGLYTSRVLLQALGVEDYGLYNVIGGIISIFTVLNSALINTTSRFITVSLAKGIVQDTRKIFNMALLLHFVVGLLIVSFGETAGLWYLQNKLVIPEGRDVAAEWLYQFTIISAFLSTINVPYNASIIAHEKINVYALIQIADVVLKLIIVLLLAVAPFDKLIFYALLILGVTVMNICINFIYCHRKFEEVKLRFFWNWRIFKEMLKFVGWAMVGNFSNMFYTQGINLMLNAFCGPAVNAARGIAVQVQGVVAQMANNVQTAINPQIMKTYAVNNLERMHMLICASSRFCYYLLFLIALPIMLEADFILKLWLGVVPEHTVNFIRLTLIASLLDAFINPMFTANLASGKLNLYYIPISVVSFSFMFITYFAIRDTGVPESVFICYLGMILLGVIVRIFVMNRQVQLPKWIYVRDAILPVLIVTILASVFPILVQLSMEKGLLRLIAILIVSSSSIGLAVLIVGISQSERQMIIQFVRNKFTNKIK